MTVKRKYRVLCLCLLAAVLLSGVGVVLSHGEWIFALTQALRRYPAPQLQAMQPSWEGRERTVEELRGEDGVVFSTCMMLVNASHPLPDGYTPTLVTYNGAQMHPLMQEPYIALRDTVEERTGIRIYVSSDYRTAEEQASLTESEEAGTVAPVGCSEHEAGLALDVYAPYYAGKSFLRSRAGRTVNRICGEFGYIIRYPDGKEDVTGISYEPWHLRYVGQPHATVIMESGITLEEYLELLTPGVWFVSGDYWILRTASDRITLPEHFVGCEISPDNTGYLIVTLKIE